MKLHLLIHSYSVDSEFYTRLETIIIFCAFLKSCLDLDLEVQRLNATVNHWETGTASAYFSASLVCHVASPSSDRLPLLCSGRLEAWNLRRSVLWCRTLPTLIWSGWCFGFGIFLVLARRLYRPGAPRHPSLLLSAHTWEEMKEELVRWSHGRRKVMGFLSLFSSLLWEFLIFEILG